MSADLHILSTFFHVLSSEFEKPLLSTSVSNISKDNKEYFYKIAKKIITSSTDFQAEFSERSLQLDKLKELINDNKYIYDLSIEISDFFSHYIMEQSKSLFTLNIVLYDGKAYCIFYLLELQNALYAEIDQQDTIRNISVFSNNCSLPSLKKKIKNLLVINLSDRNVKASFSNKDIFNSIVEKYELVLKKTTVEKMDLVTEAYKTVIEKYYDGDIVQEAKVHNVIKESVIENEEIEIDVVAHFGFGDNLKAKEEFKCIVEESGLEENSFKVEKSTKRRVNKKQKIVTANGIELYVPIDLINDPEIFEINTGKDGVIDIHLKNIESII